MKDVVPGDPTAAARSLDLGRTKVMLAKKPPDCWRHPSVGIRGRGRRRRSDG